MLSRPDLCPRTRICVGRAFHSSRHELESLLHCSFPYLGGRTPYSTSFLALASKSSSTPGVSHLTTLFAHRLSVPPDIDAEGSIQRTSGFCVFLTLFRTKFGAGLPVGARLLVQLPTCAHVRIYVLAPENEHIVRTSSTRWNVERQRQAPPSHANYVLEAPEMAGAD